MKSATRALLAISVLVLAASSCGQGDDGEIVEVVAPSAAGDASDAQGGTGGAAEGDGQRSSVVQEASSNGAGADDEADSAGDAAALDPTAVALVQAAIEESAGRAVRGEIGFDGLLVAEIGVGPEQLTIPFEAEPDGDAAIRLSGFFAEGIPVGGLTADATMELRFVGGDLFLGVPAALVEQQGFGVAGDTAWMLLDPEEAEELSVQCSVNPVQSLDLGSPQAASPRCDPLGDTATLLETMQSASVVGVEEVRGAPTTRVRVTVPTEPGFEDDSLSVAGDAGAVDAELSAESEFAEAFAAMFGEVGAELTVELWIDDDRLLRRMTVDASSLLSAFAEMFGADPLGDEVLVRTIIDIHGYDDVTVEAPPAELVIGNLSDVLGDMSPGYGDPEPPPTSTAPTAAPADPDDLAPVTPPAGAYTNQALCEAAGHIWDSTASECTAVPPSTTITG